ncbi:MAG: hypothetical protein HFH68_04745 [Lachnospiraceae bacterium]|nr:hypothetical protein [Lachnospiraceae bacterium]
MKKVIKFVAGAAAVAGTVCGVVYLLKKVFGVDVIGKDEDFDDDFDGDFDDIDDEEEPDDREYVTLDMEKEDSSEEEAAQEEDTETTVKA